MENILALGLGEITLERILTALVVLLVCLIVIRIVLRLFNQAIERLPIERNLKSLLQMVMKVLLYALAALTVAHSLGLPVTSLVAAFSVVGLALSLAAQNSLANLAGGLMILTSRPFKVGDFIEAAGVSGIVYEIGLAYTRIRTFDNKVILAPNSSISSEKITNYTTETKRRVDISVRAGYEHRIEDVKAALREAYAGQSAILDEPAPFLNILSYGESAIEYTLRVWVHTDDYWPTYFALLEDVKRSFDAHGIGMSYNRLQVQLAEQQLNLRQSE